MKQLKSFSATQRLFFAGSILLIICCMIFCAIDLNSYSVEVEDSRTVNQSEDFGVFYANVRSDALSDVLEIEKTYIIPQYAEFAPMPQQELFGSVSLDGEAGLEAVLEAAMERGFIGKEKSAWFSAEYAPDVSTAEYYLDDTIFALAWKNRIDGVMYNFCEVSVAHHSQMRRMLAGNAIGSNELATASVLASNANAVVAISGDFYSYCTRGVVVYQNKVYRNHDSHTDACYFDSNGDMLLVPYEDSFSDEQLEKFVEENDISFSLAFGPILVKDGQPLEQIGYYPTGQPEDRCARAAIGQIDRLHYLLVTVDGGVDAEKGTDVLHVAQVMSRIGCENAYTLDGGQTATLVFNGHIFNRVGYGNERDISDIVYFGTALPD